MCKPGLRLPILLLLGLVALGGPACRSAAPPAPPPAPSEAELLRRAWARHCGPETAGAESAHCAQAARLYGPEPRPLWWTPEGPTPQARALARALSDAERRGLDPAHYASGAWALRSTGAAVPDAERASRDVALSLAALRFASDLAVGRVAPSEAGFALAPEADAHDLVAEVAALSRAPDVEAALDAADPPFASYRLLEAALARYRRLARDPALAFPWLDRSVRPGDPLPEAPALARLLAATGDLRGGDPAAGGHDVYGAALAAGVARFQRRHGLTPDGILGPATAAALAVPLSARVRQIELSLERLRWLPHRFVAPPVAVNLPEFRLFALRDEGGQWTRADDWLTMRVIVGEAWERQTPVFASEIRKVVFWPYWDVPESIVHEEMWPAIERDPGYLERERLDLVARYGAAAPVLDPSPENLERLATDGLRLRQRPGPRNALGLVKFLLPNPYQVYLHGTPARGLFARDQRDLSHGCIRVEDPLALAVHVLRDQPDWPPSRIGVALAGPETQEVRLAHPVPVYVVYLTAVARPDGRVFFFPDLYGLDARLSALLAALPADA